MSENIILFGLPGVGKSAVAKSLAADHGWKFIETDEYVEKYYKNAYCKALSCRQIYRKLGEAKFRELEYQVLLSLFGSKSTVISLGGGTVNKPGNIVLLKSIGSLIYLTGNRKLIFDRLMSKGGIPAYLDAKNPYESFIKLADQREKIYDEAADIKFDIGLLSPKEIALHILKLCT